MLRRDCLWHARSWIHWGPSLRLEAVLMSEYGVKSHFAYPLGHEQIRIHAMST